MGWLSYYLLLGEGFLIGALYRPGIENELDAAFATVKKTNGWVHSQAYREFIVVLFWLVLMASTLCWPLMLPRRDK